MIDLYTGESSERMTALRLGLQRRVRWPRFLMLGGVLLVFVPAAFHAGDGAPVGMLLCLVGLFASAIVQAKSGYLPVFAFVGPRSQNRNQMIRWSTIGLLVAILGSMVVLPNLPGIAASIGPILGVLVILLAISLLLLRWSRRRLYWTPAPGGKRELVGLHPQAMELLGKEPAPNARN